MENPEISEASEFGIAEPESSDSADFGLVESEPESDETTEEEDPYAHTYSFLYSLEYAGLEEPDFSDVPSYRCVGHPHALQQRPCWSPNSCHGQYHSIVPKHEFLEFFVCPSRNCRRSRPYGLCQMCLWHEHPDVRVYDYKHLNRYCDVCQQDIDGTEISYACLDCCNANGEEEEEDQDMVEYSNYDLCGRCFRGGGHRDTGHRLLTRWPLWQLPLDRLALSLVPAFRNFAASN